jgi:hypothetical protein
MEKNIKMYTCLGCGREFKSQGIGPHQRVMKHQGRSEPRYLNDKPVPAKREYRRREPVGLVMTPTRIQVMQGSDGALYFVEKVER